MAVVYAAIQETAKGPGAYNQTFSPGCTSPKPQHQLRVQGLAESLLTVATLYSMKGWADGSPPDTHLVSRSWQVFLRVRTGFLPPEGMFSDGGWTLAWLSALCPSQHL